MPGSGGTTFKYAGHGAYIRTYHDPQSVDRILKRTGCIFHPTFLKLAMQMLMKTFGLPILDSGGCHAAEKGCLIQPLVGMTQIYCGDWRSYHSG